MLVLSVAAIAAATAVAAPGDLDPSFGNGGVVITDLGGDDRAHDVVVQTDGKIVAAGSSSGDIAVTRYAANGALDPTFGGDGTVTTDLGAAFAVASGVVRQPDGKIVVAGFAGGDFLVIRYEPGGALDRTFGSGGIVQTDFGGFDSASAVALMPDGRLVAAGLATTQTGSVIAIARYTAGGALDTSFDGDGKLVTDAGMLSAAADVVALPDGRVVVAGSAGAFANRDFVIAQYLPDGALDVGFGNSGIRTVDLSSFDEAAAIVPQSDGKLVVAGRTNNDFTLVRLGATGSLDPTFDLDGRVTVQFGAPAIAVDVVLQNDGKIVAGGLLTGPGGGGVALARLTINGQLDAGFGGDGTVTSGFGGDTGAVALAPDGDIVAVASTGSCGPSGCAFDVALARFAGDPRDIEVDVDVRPGSDENPVKPGAGLIPVAIMTTGVFDAATVDPSTVCFGDVGAVTERDCTEAHGRGHAEDVDGDGRPDLVLHFESGETGIDAGDESACLSGRTRGGVAIHGCDSIRTT
jgi:uncharacterized delta-60 repeat protein